MARKYQAYLDNTQEKIDKYFKENKKKPWVLNKTGLNLAIGVTHQKIYDLRHSRIKQTKEVIKFLEIHQKACEYILNEHLKLALQDKRIGWDYLKTVFKKELAIEQEVVSNNHNISINITQPREVDIDVPELNGIDDDI